jgi:RNA polymerase sigma-70 factor (ECF subfamily)
MMSDDRTEEFIRWLTGHQSGLFSYLVALLGDVHEARNVLQETNLVLWRRSANFAEGDRFRGVVPHDRPLSGPRVPAG